ncbi:hypothetical protein OHB14_36440 [Streptomyces sp. NBC_01613]|uniref:hypothetical protein n=1 Tax=Streptomyces sp. NBC_01613 TaxID=2975896 RepID=UPI0038702ECC
MSVRLALHWTATTICAAFMATVATVLPPPIAGYAAVCAASGVCMAGLALAPTIRKDRRP